jgi:hypothetical protein
MDTLFVKLTSFLGSIVIMVTYIAKTKEKFKREHKLLPEIGIVSEKALKGQSLSHSIK